MADDAVAAALTSLAGVKHSRRNAVDVVPRAPGLYAFHGDTTAWSELGLMAGHPGQPLYVGKAERDLNRRDVRTHFAGKTGTSTLRRSLAALLGEQLRLVAVPRNPARPDGSANFGLDAGSDQRLSAWMDRHLTLSTWTKPESVVLDEVEAQVVRRLRPPLNLDKVGEPRTRLRAARRRMAVAARSWAPAPIAPDPDDGLSPPPASELTGAELFDGLQASVNDFWRFAMSDLRMNNVRGYLAEFLVARAVGSTQFRVEWDAWDITAPDGTRIEVKSAGHLQAWAQTELTAPTFRVTAAHGWDAATRTYSEKRFHADVYVFCVHTATTHEEYDPLVISQWRFYVANRAMVEARAGIAMGLPVLGRLAGDPVPYSQLRASVELAANT